MDKNTEHEIDNEMELGLHTGHVLECGGQGHERRQKFPQLQMPLFTGSFKITRC